MKTLPALAAALTLGLLAAGAHAQDETTAKIGQPAPDFTLKSESGAAVSLKEFAGKYVVLEWTNHDCPFVVKWYKNGDMPKLQKALQENNNNVVWLQICSSAPGKQGYLNLDQAKAIRNQTGALSHALLLDPDGKVGKMYGAKTTPHMYVIAPDGTLIYSGAIDSVKSTDPADIAKATNYVTQALDQHMQGQPVTTPTSQPYGCSVKYAN